MDFSLTEEQEMFRKTAREFAQKELEPLARQVDKSAEPPLENIKKLGELGYLGMTVPEEYGGIGADYLSYVLVMEELSKACASTSTAVTVNNSLVNDPIVIFGTEEQKRKYLPDLASGNKIGAFSLSESESGTDAGSIRTRAIEDRNGKGYRLNGIKCWVTNAGFADVFLIFASTDPAAGNRGISCFIVERGMEGFTIGAEEEKMGIRGSSTCELILEDCFVPAQNLLGEKNRGFKVAMVTLNGGRIGIAAQALGIAQAALDEAVKYAKERKQFGRPICEFQAIGFMLAEMETKVEAARYLTYKAAWKKDRGEDYAKESAIAKLFASQIANEVADCAVQIHGGYGYTKDYKVERLYRDARITEIYEGTSEAQKMVISRYLLER